MPGVKGLRCQQHTYQEVPGLTQVPAATYEKKGVEDKKSHSSPHRQVTPPPSHLAMSLRHRRSRSSAGTTRVGMPTYWGGRGRQAGQ